MMRLTLLVGFLAINDFQQFRRELCIGGANAIEKLRMLKQPLYPRLRMWRQDEGGQLVTSAPHTSVVTHGRNFLYFDPSRFLITVVTSDIRTLNN